MLLFFEKLKFSKEGRQALILLLSDEELKGVPLLIIGNKNDIPTAMKPHEIIAKFRLEEMIGKSRKFVLLLRIAHFLEGGLYNQ